MMPSEEGRAILRASLGEHKFFFTLDVARRPSVSDESIFYCIRCIEQSLENLVGYDVDIHFKTSRVLPVYYENMASKVCQIRQVLEIMNPGLYDCLQERLKIRLHTRSSVCDALRKFRNVIFEDYISWEKIIALFAFTGALVVECVQQGNQEYVVTIIYTVKQFVENELLEWIKEQNGWIGMFRQFQSLDVAQSAERNGYIEQLKMFFQKNIFEMSNVLASLLQKTLLSSKYFKSAIDYSGEANETENDS